MSQYPSGNIDALGEGDRPARIRRGGVSNVSPRTGITESLDVSRLSVEEVNANQKYARLAQSLGLLGDTIGAAGQYARRERVEQEALSAEAERVAGIAERAEAAIAVDTMLPQFSADVASGKIGDPGDLDAFAEEFIRARTEGAPTEYARRYRAEAKGAIVQTLIARREKMKGEALAYFRDRSIVALGTADTPAEVDDVLDAIYTAAPHIPRREIDGATLLPAMTVAAIAGDAAHFEVLNAKLGGQFAEEAAKLRDRLSTAVKQDRDEREDARVSELREQQRRGLPFSMLAELVDSADISPERAVRLRNEFVGQAQRSTLRALESRVLAGDITREEVERRVVAAASLPESDAGFIDPSDGRQLLNTFGQVKQTKLDDAQVAAALAGGRVLLTPQHDAAIDKALGPEGAGLVALDGTLPQPKPLIGSLLAVRRVPDGVADSIVANLRSGSIADVANAAEVAGAVGMASDSLFEQVRARADDHTRAALDTARDLYGRGMFDDGAGRLKAANAVAAALTRPLPEPKPEAAVVTELKSAGVDLDSELRTAFGQLAERHPYLTDTWLGFDFLASDPAMNPAGEVVASRFRSWYSQRWAELGSGVSVSAKREIASKYARTKLRDSVDVVRWGDVARPTLIDNGTSRLPEHLRWSDGFEDEAMKDLQALGHKPEDVETLEPFLMPATRPGEEPRYGWVFITDLGSPLVNENGEPAIWTPSPALTDAAAKRRAILDAAEIRNQTRRSFVPPASRPSPFITKEP